MGVRPTAISLVTVAALGITVVLFSMAIHERPADSRPPKILFLCPHGAAKSVLASAYFQRFASQRGLKVEVSSAGTDPDPQVAPAVASYLLKGGYHVPVSAPRKVTPEELSSADVVVSIGCDLRNLPAPRGALVTWAGVPALSDDFALADGVIRHRARELVEQLARTWPGSRSK